MNKKEISEIKKQFSPNNCAITRICGCYVDGEKNKKTELKEAFLSLSEEEMFKYFEIFKKTLSGTIGKGSKRFQSLSCVFIFNDFRSQFRGTHLKQHFHDGAHHFTDLAQYIIILKHFYSPFCIKIFE